MNPHAPRKRSPEHARPAAAVAALALLLLAAFSHAWAAPVAVRLKNGDRITGEVVRESDDRIILKSPFAGEVFIPKSQVVGRDPVEVPKPAEAPAKAPAPVASKPAPPAGPAPVVPTNAPAPGWLAGTWISPFLTNWHGNVGLGMNLGFGTTERQTFFVNANAVHSWERFVNNVSYNATYGFVNQVEAANRMDGVLKTDVFIDRKRKLYTYNQFLGGYDEIRQITMRFEEGIGVGYRVYERNRMVVNAELGAQYQRFNYTRQPDRSVWSARVGENLVWKPSDKLAVTQRMQFLPNVSDPEDFRVRFELIASYPLFKKITVSLNLIDEYESRPAHGVDNNDLQVTTNINIVF